MNGFHLPGLDEAAIGRWDVLRPEGGAGVELRVPALRPEQLAGVLERLRQARKANLADRPVAEVVAAIDAAAALLADPVEPERALAERALPEITGYSPAMVRLVLDRMAADWRRPALEALLAAELDDPASLDGFVARRSAPGQVRAVGPGLAFHVFAGNVPGVAVTSLVRALLVKAASLGKTASGEPLLPVLFARALSRVDPALGACLAITYWPGGTEALEAVALDAADTVVVYGGDDAEADIRRRLPAGTRLVAHGPRLSFGAIGREALSAERARGTAARAAHAAATFDQQGCVSPHLFYVEDGGEVSPAALAALIDEELGRLEAELPRGRLGAAEAAAVNRARASAEFGQIAGRDVLLLGDAGARHAVIYDGDPAFEPSCLNRVVRVKPVPSLEEIPELVRPFARYLQTVGADCSETRRRALAERLGPMGATRVTDLERMPWPPPTAHHDGRGPLRELLRWVDLEGGTT